MNKLAFDLFKKGGSHGWVGVDVGSSSVKLVALTQSGHDLELAGYAIVPLAPETVVDASIQKMENVTEALEKGIKMCGGRSHKGVISVPSSAVITKTIQLSNAFTEMELEEQVQIEADQFIPYPLDEVALDFEVQGPVPYAPQMNEILVVACRRSDVEQREEALEGAGIRCEIVDVDTYAIERTLNSLDKRPEKGLVGIVDIGAATLTLHVLNDDRVIYNREQAFGMNDLVVMIQQQYGMSFEAVEQALRMGELDSEIQEMLVAPFRHTIAQQISRALQFFYSSDPQHQLEKLYIAGGAGAIEGMAQVLEAEVGLPADVANPFAGLSVNAKLNTAKLMRDAPLLLKAFGLSLRSFD